MSLPTTDRWILLGGFAGYVALSLLVLVTLFGHRGGEETLAVVDDSQWITQEAALLLETPNLVDPVSDQ